MTRTFDYNSEGKWSVENVLKRYDVLKSIHTPAKDFELKPRIHTDSNRGITWIYHIMNSVGDGILLGDQACVELAIQFIQDDVMDSHTGYIRERLARALKNIALSDIQKKKITQTFMNQLKTGNMYKEFGEYIKLFKVIGIEDYREEINQLRFSEKDYIQRAARRLLDE